MAELLFKDEVYAIIGATMEVYNQIGPGFGEAIYQDAMEIEVEIRNIPNNPQQEIYIHYKGKKLKSFWRCRLREPYRLGSRRKFWGEQLASYVFANTSSGSQTCFNLPNCAAILEQKQGCFDETSKKHAGRDRSQETIRDIYVIRGFLLGK